MTKSQNVGRRSFSTVSSEGWRASLVPDFALSVTVRSSSLPQASRASFYVFSVVVSALHSRFWCDFTGFLSLSRMGCVHRLFTQVRGLLQSSSLLLPESWVVECSQVLHFVFVSFFPARENNLNSLLFSCGKKILTAVLR